MVIKNLNERNRQFPLTAQQKNIWNIQQYYKGTSISNVGGLVSFHLPYNYIAFNEALNLFVENNTAFRLSFFEKNGQLYQTIAEYRPVRISEYDMRDKTRSEIDCFFTRIMQTPIIPTQTEQFVFAAVNLDKEQCGFFLCASHLICDAWGLSLVAKEIIQYYKAALSGITTPNPLPSYTEAIDTEQSYFFSPQYIKNKVYWETVFEVKPQLCRIKDVAVNRKSETRRISKVLDESLCNAIGVFCKLHGMSPVILFESIVIAYLHRINDYASPVTIGSLALNRNTVAEKKTIGMYVSTLPLCVDVKETDTMLELCEKIKHKRMELLRHQKYPFDHILQSIRAQDSDNSGLFDVMVSYQNARIDGVENNLDATWYPNGHSELTLCLHIEDMGNTGGYTVHFDYRTAIFSDAEAQMLSDRLISMLQQMIQREVPQVGSITLVSESEYAQVTQSFNETAEEYPETVCVHQLFEEQAVKTPDVVAVIAHDARLTYNELNRQANRIANGLCAHGIVPNDIVAFLLPRKSFLFAAMLGTLKSGAAYLPIDTDYPDERINHMISDSNAKFIITTKLYKDKLNSYTNLLFVEDLLLYAVDFSPNHETCSQSMCYVLYTSGSTGMPKGTLISHYNLANFSLQGNGDYHKILNACEKSACVNAISFDFSVAEIYPILLNGKTIVLTSDEDKYNPLSVNELLITHKVDLLQTTPTKVELLLSQANTYAAFQSLKYIVFCGEVLTNELIEKLHRVNPCLKIGNYYGPTETTVWSTGTIVSVADITIGRPIANTQIYILDKHQNPTPIGIVGELCISGDGVGRGYLNRPELTAEKFVPNPFVPSKRMYKTGDLARWRTDGEIEYIGRMDNQVKIRGLRIELGEIENVMSNYEGIRQVAVVDKKDETGRQYICAYYIGGEIDVGALRKTLSKALPQYMIPHFFVHMDAFPTTSSGKTDRKAFPSGNSFTNEAVGDNNIRIFGERNLFEGQALQNVYVKSKFESEIVVMDAALDGLRAGVVRVGNLSNRNNDAKFQRNHNENATLARLKAFIELGYIPDYLMRQSIEFSPVDCTASAIIKIAQHFDGKNSIFHAYSDKTVPFARLIDGLNQVGLSIKKVSGVEFSELLKHAAEDPATAYIRESFINDIDAEGRLNYESSVRTDNSFTSWFLSKLGFDWPEIGTEYMSKYVAYFRKIGYLRLEEKK